MIWLLCAAVITAHTIVQDDAVRLRSEAQSAQHIADSLKTEWSIHWRRSDSIRIESMFLRMRSDSLRKVQKTLIAKATAIEKRIRDSIAHESAIVDSASNDSTAIDSATVKSDEVDARLRESVTRAQLAKVRAGQTLSDSLTMHVMSMEPDTGTASYYAEAFHGKKTSSGEPFNMNGLTCAHRWLPYNTKLRVTNLANGKSVIVRVNDRGPFKHTRLIDLSKGAAKELDMIRAGTCRVAIEVDVPSE